MTDISTAPHPFRFLAWTVALSLPFHAWSVLRPIQGLPFGLPVSVVMIILPALVATILTSREGGARHARTLWHRIIDVDRIGDARWLAVAVLCMPLASLAAYVAMRALGQPLPGVIELSLSQAPVLIALFFFGALFEEIGWTGYATEPLQQRYGVDGAGLLIGTVWALWHVPAWRLGQGHTIAWVAGQCAATIAMRVIMGHIHAAGGRSLFLAVLFHAMINTSWVLFPNGGSHYDPIVITPVLAAIAATLALSCRAVAPKEA